MWVKRILFYAAFYSLFIYPAIAGDCVDCGVKVQDTTASTFSNLNTLSKKFEDHKMKGACATLTRKKAKTDRTIKKVNKVLHKHKIILADFFLYGECKNHTHYKEDYLDRVPPFQIFTIQPQSKLLLAHNYITYLSKNYSKDQPDLIKKILNRKDSYGRTLLDYLEIRSQSSDSSSETKSIRKLKNLFCKHGGIYSEQSEYSCEEKKSERTSALRYHFETTT